MAVGSAPTTTSAQLMAAKVLPRRPELQNPRLVVVICVCCCVVGLGVSHTWLLASGRLGPEVPKASAAQPSLPVEQQELPVKEHARLGSEAATQLAQEGLLLKEQQALRANDLDRADRIHYELKNVLRKEREDAGVLHKTIGELRQRVHQNVGIVKDTPARREELAVLAKLELQQSQVDERQKNFMAQRNEIKQKLKQKENATGLSLIKEEEHLSNLVHQMLDVEGQQLRRWEKVHKHVGATLREEGEALAKGDVARARSLAKEVAALAKTENHASSEAWRASRRAHTANATWVEHQAASNPTPQDAARAAATHAKAAEVIARDMRRVDTLDKRGLAMDTEETERTRKQKEFDALEGGL